MLKMIARIRLSSERQRATGMTRQVMLGTAMMCALMTGCWMRGTSYTVADYGDFEFARPTSDSQYTDFGAVLEDTNRRPPRIEVMLSNGKVIRCDTLDEALAESCFGECKRYDDEIGDEVEHIMHCSDDFGSVFFRDGQLNSIGFRNGAKIRKVGQTEFVTLPIEEDELIRVFGKPKEYRRVYSSQP
jgi:hypothetical protein